MDSICRQYTKNIRALFPVIGKNEKKYLNKLKHNLEEYCEETSISSLEELYDNFGIPSEVVNTYYSSVNIDHILRQIKRTKAIKTTLITLIICALIAVSAYCVSLYSEYKVFESQKIFSEETFIE